MIDLELVELSQTSLNPLLDRQSSKFVFVDRIRVKEE
jgi:hypothetical protein